MPLALGIVLPYSGLLPCSILFHCSTRSISFPQLQQRQAASSSAEVLQGLRLAQDGGAQQRAAQVAQPRQQREATAATIRHAFTNHGRCFDTWLNSNVMCLAFQAFHDEWRKAPVAGGSLSTAAELHQYIARFVLLKASTNRSKSE